MKNKEKLVTLMELGLTKNQARTYLALLQAGPTTAKELAKISKIARPDVYRVIPTLQKEGMVQKIITKPTMFEAIPAIDALPFLLNHKISKQNELKKKTAELIIDLKHNHAKKEAQVANAEFTIISGREAIVHKLKSSILKAQISVSAVTSKKRLSAAILEFAETYTKALEKM